MASLEDEREVITVGGSNRASEEQGPLGRLQSVKTDPTSSRNFRNLPATMSDPGRSARLTASKSIMKPFRVRVAEAEQVSAQVDDVGEGRLQLRDGISLPLFGEIKWVQLQAGALQWLHSPQNIALLIWVIAVAIAGGILFLVMTGMLNAQLPRKSDRNAWFEACNQILNALFTLMCLLLHPGRVRAAISLCRWDPKDILRMRKLYNRGGVRKPDEWKHMVVVCTLLHLNCFFQYCLAGLNWGYKRSERPALGVAICVAGAIGCPAAAGLYNSISPLGRDYEQEEQKMDTESDLFQAPKLLERSKTFYQKHKVVADPSWEGPVLGCSGKGCGPLQSPKVSLLSFFCCLCVFGNNIERLGFGSKYVHMATFALFLCAPFLIFDLAAINISNIALRTSIGVSGALLSVLGLLYGGYWRIKMRKTYDLPPASWCCGSPSWTDCITWLFCCVCALCQEVRTSESYDIADRTFYVRSAKDEENKMDAEPDLEDGHGGSFSVVPAAVHGVTINSDTAHITTVGVPEEANEQVKQAKDRELAAALIAPMPVTIARDSTEGTDTNDAN